MSARLKLEGKVIDQLQVISFSHVEETHSFWKCECTSCKTIKTVSAANLMSGVSSKCNNCNPNGKWKVLPKDRKDLCALYKEGASVIGILALYGIKRSTLYAILKEQGITTDRKQK